MEKKTQKEFMYLFERIGEPLYYGPRGKDNVLYMVPVQDKNLRDASIAFRNNMPSSRAPAIDVKPMRPPDLSGINKLCPKSTIFSYFSETHVEAAEQLKKILTAQRTSEDFKSMATMCRDSEMINSHMWVFAFASAALDRPDMKGFRIPAFWEIAPDLFISPTSSRMAQQQAMLPENKRKIIELSRNPTGNDTNPENKMAYFREDMGINSHHWHWHLIYTTTADRGKRDRKGELFYYMHHSMLARYNADRLANGLNLVRQINIPDGELMDEGYFPKLYNTNSGRVWGSRQEKSEVKSIDRMEDQDNRISVDLADLRKWRDRINEAIDTKRILNSDGKMSDLTPETGTDVLGDMIEASTLTPNRQVYGSLHNLGHVVIAFAHDPSFRHRENPGVLVDTTTAMRDPVFYRWHAYIDELFDKHKRTLKPYTKEELTWKGIKVTDIGVQTPKREKNVLVSNWMQSDVDLARGLDLRRQDGGAVWARTTHLNHEPFEYTIKVENSGREALDGTVRIFMAPRLNEQGRRFNMVQQRHLFFEMDKFTYNLKPGINEIKRNGGDSSITIPWESSFRELETMVENPDAVQAVCGCGWPQHMLVPRGTDSGMIFDLYVIITNAKEDQIVKKNMKTQGQLQNCKEAISFCGLLDESYPDKRAMGFPFDRLNELQNNQPINLDQFVQSVPNSTYWQVRVMHRNVTTLRGNGAPTGMKTTPDSSSRSPSPSSKGSGSRPPSPLSPGPRPGSPQSPRPQQHGGGAWNWPTNNNGGRGRWSNRPAGRSGRDTSPTNNDWTYI